MLWRAMGLLLALGLWAGCAVPGAIAYKVFGPPKVPARFAPPKEPMLVLVEEAGRGSGSHVETEELALAISQELKEHDVAPLVDVAEVHRLRDQGPVAFRNMGISEVGRRVGAKQVLYVALKRFEVESPDSADTRRVRIAAEVKVVDAGAGAVRWPVTGEAETWEWESPMVRLTGGSTEGSVRRAGIEHAAREIARWFYAWKPETMGEENREERIR